MKNLKQLLFVCFAMLLFACNNTPKHASIEGQIKNVPQHITEVVLKTKDGVQNIKIENGIFKDTINIDSDFAYLQIGENGKLLFLNKTTNLIVNANFTDFLNTLTFEGKGKKANNYLHKREFITSKIFENLDSINRLDSINFNKYVENISLKIETLLAKNKDLDPKLLEIEKENLPVFFDNLKNQYNVVNKPVASKKIPSYSFNYENYKGGDTSLESLKGNLVYIDVWATWCSPCVAEIPYLKKLEKKFHGKNIKFVSISVDYSNAKDKWKNMIKSKNMGGIQLFSYGDSGLMKAYNIKGIPRFILLDKEGYIINADAPRPSSGSRIENLIRKNL